MEMAEYYHLKGNDCNWNILQNQYWETSITFIGSAQEMGAYATWEFFRKFFFAKLLSGNLFMYFPIAQVQV